jgi:hypothetical protein
LENEIIVLVILMKNYKNPGKIPIMRTKAAATQPFICV